MCGLLFADYFSPSASHSPGSDADSLLPSSDDDDSNEDDEPPVRPKPGQKRVVDSDGESEDMGGVDDSLMESD